MTMTVAQRWRAKILAQQQLQAREALESTPQNLGVIDQDLHFDIEQLRDIERIDQRAERKRDVLLPKWLPQVEKYIQSGESYPFLPLVYCMVWLIDTGEFEHGIDLAEVAVAQGQKMPENFDNSPGAFIADNFRDWVELEYRQGHSVEPFFTRIFTLITEKWQLHEELTARWYVLAARLALRGADGKETAPSMISNVDTLEKAAALLAKADEVCPKKSGTKTLTNKIASRLRALTRD
ncbi:phage terminase small subunit [Klebsiella oxytoca]|uniref:phage terminase small subunit n=1 Tax=Klebsiella oxytoca TaxID=571 RepID=UPI002551C244|nr:phage terminase small subunit [Klebsiella oxytoca]MDK7998564.1 phage terminase small subunit [Klebsiella oxytoca]MDK8041264.1 phage terminase small subunit [Klebsiella oxytoca]